MEDLFARLRGGVGHPRLDEDRLLELKPQPEHRHDPFPLTDIQQAYLIGRLGAWSWAASPASTTWSSTVPPSTRTG